MVLWARSRGAPARRRRRRARHQRALLGLQRERGGHRPDEAVAQRAKRRGVVRVRRPWLRHAVAARLARVAIVGARGCGSSRSSPRAGCRRRCRCRRRAGLRHVRAASRPSCRSRAGGLAVAGAAAGRRRRSRALGFGRLADPPLLRRRCAPRPGGGASRGMPVARATPVSVCRAPCPARAVRMASEESRALRDVGSALRPKHSASVGPRGCAGGAGRVSARRVEVQPRLTSTPTCNPAAHAPARGAARAAARSARAPARRRRWISQRGPHSSGRGARSSSRPVVRTCSSSAPAARSCSRPARSRAAAPAA